MYSRGKEKLRGGGGGNLPEFTDFNKSHIRIQSNPMQDCGTYLVWFKLL